MDWCSPIYNVDRWVRTTSQEQVVEEKNTDCKCLRRSGRMSLTRRFNAGKVESSAQSR